MINYWFDGGLSYEQPDGTHIFHVETTAYRADFDVFRGTFLGFELPGPRTNSTECRLHERPASIPFRLVTSLQTEEGTYSTAAALSRKTQPYVMDNGPIVHRTKIDELVFDGPGTEHAEGLYASYEMLFWEDCIYVIADIAIPDHVAVHTLEMKCTVSPDATWVRHASQWGAVTVSDDCHLGIMPCVPEHPANVVATDNLFTISYDADDIKTESNRCSVAVKIFVIRGDPTGEGKQLVGEERKRAEQAVSYEVHTIAGVEAFYAGYDPMRGYDLFVMKNNHEKFQYRTFPDELERYSYRLIANGAPRSGTRRILWQRHGEPGISKADVDNADIWRPWGSQAIHRDGSGMPTGCPLQVSKNFHEFDNFPKSYSHCWLHIYSEQQVADLKEKNELVVGYGEFYNKLPAQIVQLSLMGWDDNPKFFSKKPVRGQLWHQGIYGSSEVFCLSPESVHTDNMFTDWRPIRTGKKGELWAPNYGGGDILRYVVNGTETGAKAVFVAPRVEYVSYGPLFAHVRYCMISQDGLVQAHIDHVVVAGDDMARVFIRTRYRWLDDANVSHFSLFSLGAERYNPAVMNEWISGHGAHVLARHSFELGGHEEHSNRTMPELMSGPIRPGYWFVQHGHQPDPKQEHYCNQAARGLIIRHIAARMAHHPELSFAALPVQQATSFSKPPKETIRIEVRPGNWETPAVYRLKAGDELELDAEFVIYCTKSENYDGANQNFISMLEEAGERAACYVPAWYEAVHGDVGLTARRGSISGEEMFPVVMPDANGVAEVDLSGGFGFYPLRIRTGTYRGSLQVSERVGGSWVALETQRPSGGVYQVDFREERQCYDIVYGIDSWPRSLDKLQRTFKIEI